MHMASYDHPGSQDIHMMSDQNLNIAQYMLLLLLLQHT